MTHICQKSSFQPVGLLSLDTCLNQFLLDILEISDIPGYAYQKRFTPFHRYECFQSLHDTSLSGSCHISLLHFDSFMRTNQLQIVSAKSFGIRTFRKDFKVRMPDGPGCRNLGMFGKSFIPIQILEVVFGIFHKQINRDIIQNAVQQ